MRPRNIAALATSLIVALTVAPAAAQSPSLRDGDGRSGNFNMFKNNVYVTTNTYPKHWVWITIYDLGKTTHMDYGCIDPGASRRWTGSYSVAGVYHVRGQVMTEAGCKGRQICDTTKHEAFGQYWTIYQNKTDANQCYWDESTAAERKQVASRYNW